MMSTTMKESCVLQDKISSIPHEAFSSTLAEIETEEDGFIYKIPIRVLEIRCPRLAQEVKEGEKDGDQGIIIDTDKAGFAIIAKYIYTGSVHYLTENAQVITAMKAYKVAYQLKMEDACGSLFKRIQTFFSHNLLQPQVIEAIPKLSKKAKLRRLLCQMIHKIISSAHNTDDALAEDWTMAQAEQILKDSKEYNLDHFVEDFREPQLNDCEGTPQAQNIGSNAGPSRRTESKTSSFEQLEVRSIHQNNTPPQGPVERMVVKSNTLVRVDSLPQGFPISALQKVLLQYGELKTFKMSANKNIAYADFVKPEPCAAAIEGSPYHVGGHFIDVKARKRPETPFSHDPNAAPKQNDNKPERSSRRNKDSNDMQDVCVRNLTENMTGFMIKDMLEQYGRVRYFKLHRVRQCAYAGFSTIEELKAATSTNPHVIAGVNVRVHKHRQARQFL